jgi:hypothetical protein
MMKNVKTSVYFVCCISCGETFWILVALLGGAAIWRIASYAVRVDYLESLVETEAGFVGWKRYLGWLEDAPAVFICTCPQV